MYGELYHHGILGQKWGVRRYQNPDGSLTEKGRERYQKKNFKYAKNAAVSSAYERHKLRPENWYANRLLDSDAQNVKRAHDQRNQAYVDREKAMERVALNMSKDKNAINYIIEHANPDSEYGPGDDVFSMRYSVEANRQQYQNMLSKYNKDLPKAILKVNQSEENMNDACRKATTTLLGAYGEIPINNIAEWSLPKSTSAADFVRVTLKHAYSVDFDTDAHKASNDAWNTLRDAVNSEYAKRTGVTPDTLYTDYDDYLR